MQGREFLVQHGVAGFLGRFRSDAALAVPRGGSVVVRGRRGLEIGNALCESVADWSHLDDAYIGELLRPATSDDLAASNRASEFGQRIYDDAAERAKRDRVPLAFVDVEAALDCRSIVLHALRLEPCDEGPLLAALGEKHEVIVRLYELNTLPEVKEDDHGCGSCGSEGGCGTCGSGGCSSCSSGAADELAAYFAGLRSQMEGRRTPLL